MPVDHFCSITPPNNRDFAQVTLELWWAIPTKHASVGHYTWQCGSNCSLYISILSGYQDEGSVYSRTMSLTGLCLLWEKEKHQNTSTSSISIAFLLLSAINVSLILFFLKDFWYQQHWLNIRSAHSIVVYRLFPFIVKRLSTCWSINLGCTVPCD